MICFDDENNCEQRRKKRAAGNKAARKQQAKVAEAAAKTPFHGFEIPIRPNECRSCHLAGCIAWEEFAEGNVNNRSVVIERPIDEHIRGYIRIPDKYQYTEN